LRSKLLSLCPQASERLGLERSSLKDQIIVRLRDSIIQGRIPSGTKLATREVAALFQVSPAPAREALMELEKEGLIATKTAGRYVIELSEKDFRELCEVRLLLERRAVELAARNTSPENRAALEARRKEMELAIASQDVAVYLMADLGIHQLIWRQANNRHLLSTLHTLICPILMFQANRKAAVIWHERLDLHAELIARVNAGDVDGSVRSIERHMESALRSVQTPRSSRPV